MKKIIAIFLAAILAVLCTVSTFAATVPTVTSKTVAYISFGTGNNEFSGLSADEPKKQLLALDSNGATSLLGEGGTLVVCGKLYAGGDYDMPALASTLLITSNYNSVDYKNKFPVENPACAMKMKAGAIMTFHSDTIIDDIILFQESTMNTIRIADNSTLVIGSKIDCVSNVAAANPCYMAISVDKGSTVILNGGTFQQVTGEGTIVNNGATIVDGNEPAVTTAATTAATTVATTKVTTAKVTEAIDKDETTEVAVSVEPEVTTAGESTDATASEPVEETQDVVATSGVVASAESSEETKTVTTETESGANVGLIIGIVVAAVIVIAVVVFVVVKKKKN